MLPWSNSIDLVKLPLKTKPKKTSKKKALKKPLNLRRLLLGWGIAAAAVSAILVALHYAPMLIALLAVLGLCAGLAVFRRLMTLNPLPPVAP